MKSHAGAKTTRYLNDLLNTIRRFQLNTLTSYNITKIYASIRRCQPIRAATKRVGYRDSNPVDKVFVVLRATRARHSTEANDASL